MIEVEMQKGHHCRNTNSRAKNSLSRLAGEQTGSSFRSLTSSEATLELFYSLTWTFHDPQNLQKTSDGAKACA